MKVPQRPLKGRVVSLSISESEDSANQGFPTWQVNRVTVQVVAALFGQGVGVVFGHDWREDGVMEAVHGFAQQMQPLVPLSPAEAEAAGQPLLQNLLPWPDKPHLAAQDLELLSSTLRVEPAGLPKELQAVEEQARQAHPDSELYRYVRARGLTFLRHRLDAASHARLCLGGRRSGFSGRYPGVIEEALLALRRKKPLYLAGLFGGSAQQLVDAIEGKEMPDDFCMPTPVHRLYEQPPIKEANMATSTDRTVDRNGVWSTLKQAGRKTIAEANRLTIEENEELFHTPVVDRVIELMLIGLSRIQAHAPR